MTGRPEANPWLAHARPNPKVALRLFCFPYAGGAAQIYRAWQQSLRSLVEVWPVQLPGRGHRLSEAPFNNLEFLVQAVAGALVPHLDKPFALFGHSMGALIAFELARRLRLDHGREPVHLFVSGRGAPHLSRDELPTYNLPEAEFLDELRKMNGTPVEVLEHPELMQMMLPLLRADFEVAQTYRYSPGPPLDCPITACGGMKDADVSREELEAWREHTTSEFSLHMFPGDHFFINTSQGLLLDILAKRLDQWLAQNARGRYP